MNQPIAAVSIVCFRGEDVLLVRRGRAPLLGQWTPPGGRIDWREAAAAAALRELREETGVSAALLGVADIVNQVVEGPPEAHFVLICFAARWLAGEPRAGDDAAEARFFTPGECAALGVDRRIAEAVAAARKLAD